MNNLFLEEFENQAIGRIQKFAKLAENMGLEVHLGFSGGKDSIVCYDLCKRAGIVFKSYYNQAFESPTTLNFIRENFMDVIWRRDYKIGFFQNIIKHGGMLPTVDIAYCCENYKHNPKYVDKCSIVGVRRAESNKRKNRKTLEFKNKTLRKKNKDIAEEYFATSCMGEGVASDIQLKPIIDWSDSDVWDYIRKYNLPVNPEYKHIKRVGCMICPKAQFSRNFYYLKKYPKLIDCIIHILEKSKNDFFITKTGEYYGNTYERKVEFVCRWLNYSYRDFSKKDQKAFEDFMNFKCRENG